jgi:predicted transglutaminase-like protease
MKRLPFCHSNYKQSEMMKRGGSISTRSRSSIASDAISDARLLRQITEEIAQEIKEEEKNCLFDVGGAYDFNLFEVCSKGKAKNGKVKAKGGKGKANDGK